MKLAQCICGVMVDLSEDKDAQDIYGEVECKLCRKERMDHMWEVMKEQWG